MSDEEKGRIMGVCVGMMGGCLLTNLLWVLPSAIARGGEDVLSSLFLFAMGVTACIAAIFCK